MSALLLVGAALLLLAGSFVVLASHKETPSLLRQYDADKDGMLERYKAETRYAFWYDPNGPAAELLNEQWLAHPGSLIPGKMGVDFGFVGEAQRLTESLYDEFARESRVVCAHCGGERAHAVTKCGGCGSSQTVTRIRREA